MKDKRRIVSVASVFVLLLILSGLSVVSQTSQQRVQIVVLGTTDLHGNLLPVDYYTDKPDNRGLAKVATLIKRVRKETPNVVLVDSGDTIQGTPLAYYHNKKNNQPPNPMMLAMSALKYDSMTVGNHEYNFGLKVLEKARSEANFPWLSANTYNKGTNETHYKPYIIKEVSWCSRRNSGFHHARSADLGKRAELRRPRVSRAFSGSEEMGSNRAGPGARRRGDHRDAHGD